MKIKELGFNQNEIELLKMVDAGDHMYDQSHFSIITKELFVDNEKNTGVFKVFIYKNSLRISVLLDKSPCPETVTWLIDSIKKCINSYADKDTIFMWYSQKNGFSNAVLDQFTTYNPNYFYKYQIKNKDIILIEDKSGLEKRQCTEDMIDACIEVMEDLFTPFPDTPGSFRKDRERIKSELINDNGCTELFFKEGELVGFCGHQSGHIIDVCVRKKFQGMGYGKVMVRSILKSIYELGCDAELTTGHYNDRAISLYEKVGFIKLFESMGVNIVRT